MSKVQIRETVGAFIARSARWLEALLPARLLGIVANAGCAAVESEPAAELTQGACFHRDRGHLTIREATAVLRDVRRLLSSVEGKGGISRVEALSTYESVRRLAEMAVAGGQRAASAVPALFDTRQALVAVAA